MKKKDDSRELAIATADLAADVKAVNITILELREVSSVADYFVVASGRSHIQVEAICDHVVEGVQQRLHLKPQTVEGLENSQWAVLDYGSVVVHVFQESVRELYDLERLWSLAPRWKHEEGVPAPPVSGKKTGTTAKKTAASPRKASATGEGTETSSKRAIALPRTKSAAASAKKVASGPATPPAAAKTGRSARV